jgi:prepilin-type N-terminal cleavage/methylation domain-containing protein
MLKNRRGFTLIEAIIVTTIVLLLSTVIFQMIYRQSRYTELHSAREEGQENARGVLELLTSELRTVAADSGILYAGADSLALRVPGPWGRICGLSASNTLDVVFPRTVWTAMSTYYPSPVSIVLTNDSATAVSGVAPYLASNVGYATSAANGTMCQSMSNSQYATYDTTQVSVVRFSVGNGFTGHNNRMMVYPYHIYAYGDGDAPSTTSMTDRWIYRGAVISPAPGTNTSAVRAVRVVLTTRARKTVNHTNQTAQHERQVDSITVYVRN